MGPSGTGVYDKEDSDQQARPHVADQRPVDADALRGFEEDMAGSGASKLADKFNRAAEGKPKNTASPENLLNAENAGVSKGSGPISKKRRLANTAMHGIGGEAQSFLKKHKKKLLLGGIGSISLIGIVGFILFFIGLLALPNYAENIAARSMAKVTRAAHVSTRNLVNEKMAIDSLSESDHAQAKAKYAPDSLRGKAAAMFERLDGWRFNKTMQNLGTHNLFQTISDNKGRLVAITYSTDGGRSMKKVDLPDPGFFEQRLHPIRTLEQRLDVQREVSFALGEALKTKDLKVPTVARGYFLYKFMKTRLGVGLKGLTASKYLGKNPREARILVQQDSFITINDDRPSSFTNTDLREAADEAQNDLKESMQDPEQAAETVDNPGEPPKSVTQKVNDRFNPAKLSAWSASGIVGAINPIYDIALPVCLVYDGSRLPTEDIDKRISQASRSAGMVLTNADIQKNGTQASAEAIGALNWKLGDTNQSNALRTASGESVDTLAEGTSPQGNSFGGFAEVTIFNALLDSTSPEVANQLNSFADDKCPLFTNIWFGVGVGVVNVVATGVISVFTGGGAAAGQVAATQAAKQAVLAGLKRTVSYMIQKVTTKQGLKSLGKAAYKEVQFWGAVEIATLIAKSLVGAHALTGNGLAVGTGFANEADMGAKSLGNDMSRVNFGGRALTDAEAVESMAEDEQFLKALNTEKGMFERYFALDNPTSLLTKVGMNIRTSLNVNLAGSLLNKASNIFNPLAVAPKLLGGMNQKVVYAAEGNVASLNYGLVQFGWTKAETELINKTPSYRSPSANQISFFERSDAEKIQEEYGPCIDGTVGEIIGGKWIERDNTTGNVAVDKGKCSPQNMGPNNPAYGDGVFRLRLIRFYDAPLSTYEGIAEPVEPGSANTTTFPTTGGPGELSWPIAKADGVTVTDCYGTRGGAHKGLDIGGPLGTPILAASDGRVTRAGFANGYGPHFVIIQSPGVSTSYGHMNSHSVSVGDNVKAGQQIGTMGNEGQSYGVHLHFNTFKGAYSGSDAPNFNPLTVMKIPPGVGNGASCK